MTGLGTTDPLTTVVASIAFWVAAFSSVLAAGFMVLRVKNMVRAALALTITLGGVAVIFAILGADFLAVVQLVVYVGAIMVLLIFAIFMTPGQVDVPGLVGPAQRGGAFLVAAVIFGISVLAITGTAWNVRAMPLDVPTTELVGGLILSRYVLPFEIASALLTAALLGAIVIARED